MPPVELRGISWDHPRGHDCMVATAQAYAAVQPEVRVVWETRSRQDFADYPVQKLAETYDLLVIDHPFVGFAAADGCLLPLDEQIDAKVHADQATHSVGPSHRSYLYSGHQWALATDAAGHVAAYRPDLLDEIGGLPSTWDAVLAVAEARRNQERARVGNPLIPIDALMSFCSICAAADDPPYRQPDRVVSRATGRQALGMLKSLKEASHPASSSHNPPRMLDLMSTTDEIAYIPLLFGYSNYARPEFRPSLIRFTGVPTLDGGVSRGGILGGAGVAISTATKHPTAAAAYAAYVASSYVQRGIYFAAGGQPGHRTAWLDEAVNAASSDFFRDTLAALDRAYLRPRYLGFMEVQERSGELIHDWLAEGGSADDLLDRLNALYRTSEPEGKE
jgi:multiple sugar transport system substrate-binding protein